MQQLTIALQQQPQGGQLQIQEDQIRVLNDGGGGSGGSGSRLSAAVANGSMTALRNIVGQQIQMQVLRVEQWDDLGRQWGVYG